MLVPQSTKMATQFLDIVSNPGLYPINFRIFESMNYEDLKKCCQVSSELENYIKTNCLKWKLFEILDTMKSVKKSLGDWMFFEPQDFGFGPGDNLPEDLPLGEQFVQNEEDQQTILYSFGQSTFDYFETYGTIEELKLFLEFIDAWLKDEETMINT